MCLGYKGDKIRNYFLENPSEYNIEMVDTGEDSTKSKRLLQIKDRLDEEFLVSYGDDLADVNISKLIDFHRKQGKIVTLTAVKLNSPYGSLKFDEFDPLIVSNFEEKPIMKDWINGGYFLFNKKIFDYIEEADDLEKEVFEKIVGEKQIAAFRHAGFWKSVSTLNDFNDLNKMLLRGEIGNI